VSNTIYRVETNPDLDPDHWTAVPPDITATSTTASTLVPLTPTNGFYRVRVLP
jgi:hypothetical protein